MVNSDKYDANSQLGPKDFEEAPARFGERYLT